MRYPRRAARSAPVLLLVCLFLLTGCATGPNVMDYRIGDAEYVWPAAPEVPRYRLVGQLIGEENLPRSQQANIGSRFLGWLAGFASGKRTPDELQRPQSGFVDEQGRIYIADVSRAAIYVFDESAGKLLVWEAAGRAVRFETPVSIMPGANGEILVVDAGLNRVIRLNADGEPVGSFGGGHFVRPVGIARDAERGRIFVADVHAHDIKIFSDDGELIGTIGHSGHRGEGPGEFNSPTYLTYAKDHLYITDTLNSRVQVFDAEDAFVREFGGRGLRVGNLPRPKGVAVDDDGRVYVVESYYDHLLVFNDEGDLLLPIGGTGSGAGEFYLPAGVWTDSRNRVYVADTFNGRVMIFEYVGGA